MKNPWKIILWIVAVYLFFNLLGALLGVVFSLIVPLTILYIIYRGVVRHNRISKRIARKVKNKTGVLIYKHDWWKLIISFLAALPLYWFAQIQTNWISYTLIFTFCLIAGYFFITAFRRWTYLEISDFGFVRVDHKYFFRHKLIYDWSRIYYTEVSTEGLNYQLYVATLDGSFTIKQNDVKGIAIPELKKIVDSYIRSKTTKNDSDIFRENEQNDNYSGTVGGINHVADSVLDATDSILATAKNKFDEYLNQTKLADEETSIDLTPIIIFKKKGKSKRPFGQFTAYGFEFSKPLIISKNDTKIFQVPWKNISDIKVDDLKRPSQLELNLKLANGYDLDLLIADSESGQKFISLLEIKKLYLRVQTLKSHSKHKSMTV
ncbi:hypothetical protein [Oenococcus oeni]|mgnify:FL=1|uniref:hypothetical protein n=1 Tax=Oenococcus oeni TaxID=1247 RepID=UPI000277BAA0|nr:hypothetical protein [Oenococcus oeni]AVI94802.1 hypothetical protein AX764_08265 [Oenococcus oeni]EJO03248.1 hypothetical protein AWRIB418_70 [Oenococcus oeni AWRIB418]OIK56257.1 hypothetical protein ATW61_08360 [Oenococcus oeni]OIL19123.1 hypothetical protein ATW99_08350 [Oenococcus oeni]OIL22907.1 hypothetical protein ATX01_08730 [Oenococcus oeni]